MSLSFSMIHSVPSISTRYFYVESVLFLIHLSDSSSILFSHCYSHLQIMSTMYHPCPLFIYFYLALQWISFKIWSFRCHIQLHTFTYTCPLISAQRWNNASLDDVQGQFPSCFNMQLHIDEKFLLSRISD